ncbi:MAG: patatin-like phospholipase family protein, partial [Bryobacteraceae bacterium]
MCLLFTAVLCLSAADSKPRIALTLSGGSALGLAHVGVIQWLEEHRIPISYIGGTSMGALVGGIYASGYDSAELKKLVQQIDWNGAFRRSAPFYDLAYRRKEDRRSFPNSLEFGLKNGFSLPSGLSPGQEVGLILSHFAAPYGDMESFDNLPTPFRCVAMDLLQGKQVVFSKGSLVSALRASMSLPALFTPFETENMLLVDGATLNNLPVDIVKAMGPSIVIAVPLIDKPVDKTKIRSLLAVAGRTLAVMIDDNAKRNMALADLLIAPDLTGLESTDFFKFEEFEKRGYEAAEKKKQFLMTLAVSEEEYGKYVAERQRKRRSIQITPTFVAVEGITGPAKDRIQNSLESSLADRPLDQAEVDKALTTITGYGPYQSASYTFARHGEEAGLAVRVREKPYGPPFVNTGINIEGADTSNIRFGLGGRVTFMNTGLQNSEWRTDFTIGLNNSIQTEYYWRLKDTKWFLAPRALFSQRREDLYSGGQRTNEIKVRDAGFGGDLGYTARLSELRLGYAYDSINGKVATGGSLEGLSRAGFHAFRVRFAYDGQDSNVIARRGLRSVSDAKWNFSTGGASQYGVLESITSFSKSYGPRYVLLSNLAGGSIIGPSAVFPPF